MQETQWVGLAETINGIRSELTQAVSDGDGEKVRFEVGDIELELTVEVKRDVKAETGVKVWVMSLGSSGTRSSGTTNRLKVVLRPKNAANETGAEENLTIADQDTAIPPRRSKYHG